MELVIKILENVTLGISSVSDTNGVAYIDGDTVVLVED